MFECIWGKILKTDTFLLMQPWDFGAILIPKHVFFQSNLSKSPKSKCRYFDKLIQECIQLYVFFFYHIVL